MIDIMIWFKKESFHITNQKKEKLYVAYVALCGLGYFCSNYFSKYELWYYQQIDSNVEDLVYYHFWEI